jgi:hypothetical protein
VTPNRGRRVKREHQPAQVLSFVQLRRDNATAVRQQPSGINGVR